MKFVKIAAATSVLAMSASGAFAFDVNAKTVITDALADINSAYTQIGGGDADRYDVAGAAAHLMYTMDNVGAVEGITWEIDQDPASATFGKVNVEVDTYTGEELNLDGARAAFVGQIKEDFYGSSTGSVLTATVSQEDGVWGTSAEGLVGEYLDSTVVARSNDLNEAVADAAEAGFNAGSLAGIDSAVDDLNGASEAWNSAVEETNTAIGASASDAGSYALRAVGQGYISIEDNGVETSHRSHVGTADTFTYNDIEGSTYRSIVDAYLTNEAPAAE